jgi:uncharacterized protein
VSAGAIRDAVWDALHDRPRDEVPRDVDLGFFDPTDLTDERDQAVEAALRAHAPALPWETKNQAAVHLWYPRRFGLEVAPFASCAEAVATFPEVATCVGARLLDDDDMLVVAPHGLGDLLGCVCRHNPTRVPASLYERRLAEKGWRALAHAADVRFPAPARVAQLVEAATLKVAARKSVRVRVPPRALLLFWQAAALSPTGP